jgi:hypothetical protein
MQNVWQKNGVKFINKTTMNSIINIEDRLHIVKQLFELQIKVGAQFDTILLSTEYLKWVQNDFRAESIGANLSDLKQLKMLKNILSLSEEIMKLYINLPKYVYILDRTTSYKFEGIPYGAKFRDSLLTKKEDGKRYKYLTRENTVSVLKNDDWVGTWSLMHEDHWKDYSYFEIWEKSREFNFLFDNYGFFDFARNTYLFLVDSVFIKNQQTDKKTFSDYLNSKNKDAVIAKIQALDRDKPKNIFIILQALLNGEVLLMSDNNTIYEAYYNQFGYHEEFTSFTRALNYYDWNNVDRKLLEKIEIMTNHLCD